MMAGDRSNPIEEIIDFTAFQDAMYVTLCGYKPTWDETTQRMTYVRDPEVVPFCNKEGADFARSMTQTIFSKHNVLADLSDIGIAKTCSSVARGIALGFLKERRQFEIKDWLNIQFKVLNIWDSLFLFLSSLREGGVKDTIKNTVGLDTLRRELASGQGQGQGLGINK